MAITAATSHVVVLERETDVYVACERAASLAGDAGFDRYACADIETAVSEICTNTLRHADRGWVAIRVRESTLEVAVTDQGPGFGGPRKSPPGLGIGLEGARRLMGELSVSRLPDGSRVTMTRRLPEPKHGDTSSPAWSIAAVFRTKTGQVVCGDAIAFEEAPDASVWVALADGLGAGPNAALASQRVLESMDLTRQSSPSSALAAAHHAARGTRGAVAAAVHLFNDGTGVHGAIGDVSCQITSSSEPLVSRPGIIGTGTWESADTPFRLPDGAGVALWTDGLRRPNDDWRRQLPPIGSELGWMEEAILALGNPSDDGALVIVRRKP